MNAIESIEENFSAVGRYWGSFNSSFTVVNGINSMNTGISTADLNWAWNERPLMCENAADISSIKHRYRQSGLPLWWWVYPSGQSPLTKTMLEDAGFHLVAAIPCLAADLSAPAVDAVVPPEITVSLVKSREDLSRWEDVSFTGFAMDDPLAKQYHKFIGSFDISVTSPQKLFLAYFDGNPAGTALVFFYKDTAGIYFVSTLPAYRRRGMGRSLTHAVMSYARNAGSRFGILQSSKAGLNVYRRAGFKEYCRADVYTLN
jgi:ribosomal protein S18 acetylase RimI-like enzyme